MGMTKFYDYTVLLRYDASPEAVFSAFTDPLMLSHWIWGKKAKECFCEFDATVGGHWSASYLPSDNENWHRERWTQRGFVAQIVPNERLVLTVHWDAPVFYNADLTVADVADELLTIDFQPDGEGCLLTWHHAGIPDETAVSPHHRAVKTTLEDLRELVE